MMEPKSLKNSIAFPEDGYINWSNDINEIYNLVRAVTKPYPGAFTYFNDNKSLPDKINLEALRVTAKSGETKVRVVAEPYNE